MKAKLIEHLFSILLVTLIAVVGMRWYAGAQERGHRDRFGAAYPYIDLPVADMRTPFRTALFEDLLDWYHPGDRDGNREAVQALREYRLQGGGGATPSGSPRQPGAKVIAGMYARFLAVFALVLALTWYGALTLGLIQFVRMNRRSERQVLQRPSTPVARATALLRRAGAGTVGFAAQCVLFSPAFVIAYSIRTQFTTDTVPFLVALSVLSNGLLATYANKCYTLLVAEGRKGYVRTARVKNLCSDWDHTAGVGWRSLLAPRKRFDGHILGPIYRNAALQYIPTVKEQASFLITGLVITEMALNIHGYLSYELLRQLLYRNVSTAVLLALLIFYAVKIADIVIDGIVAAAHARYNNTGAAGGAA